MQRALALQVDFGFCLNFDLNSLETRVPLPSLRFVVVEVASVTAGRLFLESIYHVFSQNYSKKEANTEST